MVVSIVIHILGGSFVHSRRFSSVQPRLGAKERKEKLVHAEHDGGAGDGAKEMRRHAAVQTDHSFFLENELETLHQAGVFGDAVSWRGLP